MRRRKKPPMQRSSGHKRRAESDPNQASTPETVSPPRAGLPATDAILSEETFKSPTGKIYRILKTNETDEYDAAEKPKGTGS